MSTFRKASRASGRIVVPAVALAALSASAGSAAAQQVGNLVTISISGSTAMRNFTISTAFDTLPAGFGMTLSNGSYAATSSSLVFAPSTANGGTVNLTGSTGPGVTSIWHEAGSIEGILEMANDQIGYYQAGAGSGPIVDRFTIRDPSALNNVRVQGVALSAPGTTAGGYTVLSSTYNTYSATNFASGGTNLLGGQNRVQWAISDVKPVQGFSTATGTYTSSIFARPGTNGYGAGNPALPANTQVALDTGVANLGTTQGRQQLAAASKLNMQTDKIDPATGAPYGTGAWNTAGLDNLVTKTVAITATTFAANPGTGLTSINRTDAQFLQATGRLPNGVNFNVSTRDINSGTRNTAALNTGIDPSWAVGENDGGNGYNLAGGTGLTNAALGDANAQATIGAKLQFSGKTAGGAQLRPTVQNNRMSVGTLSLSDIFGAASTSPSSVPLRGLSLSNTEYNNGFSDAGFSPVAVNAANITNGSYAIWQQEQYVFVKRPDAAGYGVDSVYKGDTTGGNGTVLATGSTVGNVGVVSNNILTSVNKFPNANSLNTPADGLLTQSFILPQFMLVGKDTDGGAVSPIAGNVTVGTQTNQQWHDQFLADTNAQNKFNLVSPNAILQGSGGKYGVNGGQSTAYGTNAGNTQISITTSNYLFGDFNQTGIRDFSALKTAVEAQKLIAADTGMFDGGTIANQAVVVTSGTVNGVSTAGLVGMSNQAGTVGATKGDLIVMGDFNGDGKFDGKDLLAFARGAAIADSVSGDTVAVAGARNSAGQIDAFSAKIRTAALVKNAAMDYLQAHASTQQKTDAAVTNTAEGIANAFNKADVNSDGRVDLNDAFIIDKFSGYDYASLTNSVSATIGTDGKFNSAGNQKIISLTDVKLVDTLPTDSAARPVQQADMAQMNASLTGTVSYAWDASTVKPGNLAITVAPVAGTFTVPAGASLTINAGSFTAGGTVDPFTTGANHMAIANNAGFGVSGGTKVVSSIIGTGSVTVSGGSLVVAPNAVTPTVVLRQSSVSLAGTLTLSNDAILTSATDSAIGSLVASGKLVEGIANPVVGLGVITNDNGEGGALFTTFDGVGVSKTDVLIKTTLLGDTDLNGVTDGSDLANLLAGMNGGLKGWVNGDTNYDGVVNVTDLTNLLASMQSGLSFGGGNGGSGGAVPEPGSLGLAIVPGAALLGRRRVGVRGR